MELKCRAQHSLWSLSDITIERFIRWSCTDDDSYVRSFPSTLNLPRTGIATVIDAPLTQVHECLHLSLYCENVACLLKVLEVGPERERVAEVLLAFDSQPFPECLDSEAPLLPNPLRLGRC